MELIDILHRDCCRADLKASNKDEVLEVLADLALRHPDAEGVSREDILESVLKREEKGSTGIGNQLAIPHGAVKGLKSFVVVLATSKRGVDFKSIDKKRAHLFFMILGPEGEAHEHLKILATISRTISLPGVKGELIGAESETALYESFVRHLSGGSSGKQKKEEYVHLSLYLFDEELIYDILELFIKLGIEGANVVESYGMGEYISNVPLFAGFLGFINDKTNRSKLIQALIPKSRLDSVTEGIESITGDLDKKMGAAYMVTPVLKWKGSMKMM